MINLNPSRKPAARTHTSHFTTLFLLAGFLVMRVMTQAAGLAATNTPAAIPWSEIGAKAGANYQGDGLAVTPTESGARLHCVFQRLDGEATPEGLWLTSTVTNTVRDRFRVTAMAVGRVTPCAPGAADRTSNIQHPTSNIQLEDAGIISLAGQTVRLSRPGLTEEYSVSMDGVRQDFIVEQAPASAPAGELVVRLAVTGAQVEPTADGARLVLANSGRKIAYSRLRVTDATGKELPARIEIASGILPDVEGAHPAARNSGADSPWAALRNTPEAAGLEAPAPRQAGMPAATSLVVVVDDAAAVYPVRIDPTFSDANWISMGDSTKTYYSVDALVVDASGNLYVGGTFSGAGNTLANNIVQWNGSSWSALGSGISGSVNYTAVEELAVSGSTLYAGGQFTNAGGMAATNIAKWDGTNWSALGSWNGGVSALAAAGSTLYVGGGFTNAGGIPANYVAQWDGSSWSALGSGISGAYDDGEGDESGPAVSALAVSGGTLYVGGDFAMAGGVSATNIAKWDGSSWSALGSGISGGYEVFDGWTLNVVNPYVSALAVSGSTLYAGGLFTTAGSVWAANIAQWNGSSWSALGSGISEEDDSGNPVGVKALAVLGSDLYAGAQIWDGILKWDGSSWSVLGSGLTGSVYTGPIVIALAVSGSTLYAGGIFTTTGGVVATNLAQWDGSNWSAIGSGMGVSGGNPLSGQVNAVAVSGGTVYAGGEFSYAGGSVVNNIAQWNGSGWSALGLGLNYEVFALAVSGGTVYAGGEFTTAGGNPANSIAQWNGTNWSPLGSGISGGYEYGPIVYALAVSGSTVYAGGYFATAGGIKATNIAQWNGSSWSALGSGISSEDPDYYIPWVSALAVSGGTLYAGGVFTTAGGSAANNIAKWNGSSWSALGSGMSGAGSDGEGPWVEALAVSGGTLYAGGDFTTAGGNPANYIAQWNGSSWSPLGSGITGAGYDGYLYVQALAVSGGTLYAGGDFMVVGGSAANFIAQWNGSSWSPLGSGMSGGYDPNGPHVYALAAAGTGSDLYAGGAFTTAGGTESDYAARAILRLPSLTLRQTNSSSVAVSWPSPSPGFVLQQNSAGLGSVNWSNVTDSMVDDGTNKMITQPMETSRFFRLVLP